MALLNNHLEQIALSARSIRELEFPPPKMFVNALLGQHEITTLIRDTEPYERALFSINSEATQGLASRDRRATLYNGNNKVRRRTVMPAQHQQRSAIAKVLGNDMLRQIQQSGNGGGKRGVNVEVLLQGAERLGAVYSLDGASERIAAIRQRHASIVNSTSLYEQKLAKQKARMADTSAHGELEVSGDDADGQSTTTPTMITDEDLRAEEEEIKALERRKKDLELRMAQMDKELGGLLL